MLAALALACHSLASAQESRVKRDSVKSAQSVPVADPAPAPIPDTVSGTVTAPAPAPGAAAPNPIPAPAPSVQAKPDSAAETVVGADEPEGITIEVDANQSRNQGKSLPLALLLSATLPGSGELYLEDRGKAKTFLLMEAGFWAGLYVAWLSRESYLQSARNHASEYAGIDAGSKSEKFLETMAVFRAYQEKQHRQDSYELAQVLSGKREQDYDIKPVEENYWDFGSSANPENTRNWRSFQSTLHYYRASKVAMSFALGALALNRLGSLMNTLQTYKRTSAKNLGWELTPDLGPDYAGTRFTVRF